MTTTMEAIYLSISTIQRFSQKNILQVQSNPLVEMDFFFRKMTFKYQI